MTGVAGKFDAVALAAMVFLEIYYASHTRASTGITCSGKCSYTFIIHTHKKAVKLT